MSHPEPSGPDLDGVVADANAVGLPYVVIGGFSVMANGFVRATKDSNLLVPAAASAGDLRDPLGPRPSPRPAQCALPPQRRLLRRFVIKTEHPARRRLMASKSLARAGAGQKSAIEGAYAAADRPEGEAASPRAMAFLRQRR